MSVVSQEVYLGVVLLPGGGGDDGGAKKALFLVSFLQIREAPLP